jgi:hypothetical protein
MWIPQLMSCGIHMIMVRAAPGRDAGGTNQDRKSKPGPGATAGSAINLPALFYGRITRCGKR